MRNRKASCEKCIAFPGGNENSKGHESQGGAQQLFGGCIFEFGSKPTVQNSHRPTVGLLKLPRVFRSRQSTRTKFSELYKARIQAVRRRSIYFVCRIMFDADDHADVTGAMPQGELQLRWRENYRRELPHYRDFLRNSVNNLTCAVMEIEPALRLPWRYTEEQTRLYRTWECSAIWLHSAAQQNGAIYLASLFADLEEAINIIARDKSTSQFTLLVSPSGMSYDANRFGGDHQVMTSNGHRFTFSVRKGVVANTKILLAVSWDA